jgi:hypothetical protein
MGVAITTIAHDNVRDNIGKIYIVLYVIVVTHTIQRDGILQRRVDRPTGWIMIIGFLQTNE